jgi:pseudaminic acid cytidylyltransferase
MSKVAIIPARGGSKRIPRKNLKIFLGKPILAYSIEAALSSDVFDEVMVSTDDDEIAEIAKGYGAVIPFKRSNKNSDDFANTVDVLVEVLQTYQAMGKIFEFGCCIYPTAPFVTSAKLLQAFDVLSKGSFDSVFPVLKYGYPIQRSLRFEGNKIKMVYPEHLNSRSQDLESTYHDSGQFYWFSIEAIISKRKMFTDNAMGILTSELEAQDIDTELDWKLAELKFELMRTQNAGL